MGLFKGNQETKIQLYFRDANKFRFIRRPLKFSCIVEMAGDAIVMAWKHFFATELPFAGYKKIPAGMVTLGFSRDIILDPFNRIPEGTEVGQKPIKGSSTIKAWIAKMAENQRHTYRSKPKVSFLQNKIIWTEIGVICVMSAILLIRALT